jgi:hypothetical protein
MKSTAAAFLAAMLAAHVALAEEFTVSYWYGPPAKFSSLERYKQIKDANCNVVFPPAAIDPSLTPQQNLQILDFCKQLNLKAVVYDPRMPRSISDSTDAKAKIDAIIADYGNHPALLAYFIVDEPSAGDFPKLGEVMAYLKERDPKHPGYINLFPMHADKSTQLGTSTYEEYVRSFVKTVDPFVISYDHYPFHQTFDQPEFFPNLAAIRNASITHQRPFWNIVQCTQHYDYRALTEPELRFLAMQTLAFGGKGLLWYTYWYPGEPNDTVKHSMINHDGRPDQTYMWIKTINVHARAIGNELIKCKSWATFQTGLDAQFAPPAQPFVSTDTTLPLTIGVFRASDDSFRALITNRDYRKRSDPTIRIDANGVDQFDPTRKTWSPLTLQNHQFPLDLPPGGGVLLRWIKR